MKTIIGVGDGRGAGRGVPPYNSEKIFGQFLCKIRTFFAVFSGKNHVKLWNFVNFGGKNHVKFGQFVNFSYIFLSGQNCRAP